MKYRLCKTKDHQALQSLNRRVFGKGLDLDFSESINWLVYDEKTLPVGFCCYKETDPEAIYLSRAGLLERARGAGLQKRMIAARLKHAKRMGYKYAITYTMLDNAPSFSSLQKNGFKLFIPEYKWAGDGVLYWIKRLTRAN